MGFCTYSIRVHRKLQFLKIIQNMPNNDCRRKNSRISVQRRSKLIELIQDKGISLYYASKRLNLKLSTARAIMDKYTKTGSIFNKNMKNKDKKLKLKPTSLLQLNQQSEVSSLQNENNPVDHSVIQQCSPFINCEKSSDVLPSYPYFFWVIPQFSLMI